MPDGTSDRSPRRMSKHRDLIGSERTLRPGYCAPYTARCSGEHKRNRYEMLAHVSEGFAADEQPAA